MSHKPGNIPGSGEGKTFTWEKMMEFIGSEHQRHEGWETRVHLTPSWAPPVLLGRYHHTHTTKHLFACSQVTKETAKDGDVIKHTKQCRQAGGLALSFGGCTHHTGSRRETVPFWCMGRISKVKKTQFHWIPLFSYGMLQPKVSRENQVW